MGFYRNKKVGDPKWVAGDEEHDEALNESGMAVEALSRVTGRPTEWLVENVIADQGVTIVAGEPGSGKSFIACQIAADTARELEHRVVLATAGYEPPELLRWRLDRAEGDAQRVALATLEPKGFFDQRQKPSDDTVDERMAMLYHLLEAAGDPKSGILPAAINLERDNLPSPRAARLLVIDDVDGWFGKPGNMLSPAALARVIQRLNKLARTLRVAVVVLARLQLSVEGRITSRQLSRLSHAASVVWTVVKEREKGSGFGVQGPEKGSGFGVQGSEAEDAEEEATKTQDQSPKTSAQNPKSNPGAPGENPKSYTQSSRRWFLPVKNNLAPDVLSVGRSFELVEGRIRWHCDDPAPELAEALLPSVHSTDRRRLRHEAGQWAEEALAAGPLPSKQFYELASDNGYTRPTMQRALSDLGIRPHKTGFDGGWELRWPERQVLAPGTSLRAKPMPFRVVDGGREDCKSQIPARENCELARADEEEGCEESQLESPDSPCLSEESQVDEMFVGGEQGRGGHVNEDLQTRRNCESEAEGCEESQLESRNSPCLSEESQVDEMFVGGEQGRGGQPAEDPQPELQNSPSVSEESQLVDERARGVDCELTATCTSPTGRPDEANPKTQPRAPAENPKSPAPDVYAALVDALRDACFSEAG